MISPYRYRAVSRAGTLAAGVMQAESAVEVSLRLDRQGFIPLRVKEVRPPLWRALLDRPRRAPLGALIVFTRQLGTLYRAGIPLVRSFEILSAQCSDATLKRAITELSADLQSGVTLPEAFDRRESVFGRLMCAAVRAGEATGQLDQVLDRLAAFLERELKTREDLKDALRYPILVVAALGGAFVLLVTFVFPRFQALFSRFNTALPLPTRVLMGLSVGLRHYWAPVLALVAVGIILARRWLAGPRGEMWADEAKLRLPILGPVFLQVVVARFSHMMAILTRSGLPLVQSLRVAGAAVGNRTVAGEIARVEAGVIGGQDAGAVIGSSRVFPPLAAQMFAVGAESGALDQMLVQMAAHYDHEVEYATRRLSKMVEPALTLLLGSAVLFFALAVFLPMWNLLSVFRK